MNHIEAERLARMAADEAARESDQRLRMVLATAKVGLYERDLPAGKAVYDSELLAILGLPEGTDGAESARQSLHPEDRDRVLAAIDRALDPQLRAAATEEFRIVRPDGQVRWVVGSCRVLFKGQGHSAEPKKLLGVVRDITERKEAELALKTSEERACKRAQEAQARQQILVAMMEHIPMGITIADAPSLRIRAVSRYGREMLGETQQLLEGMTHDQFAARWRIFRPGGVTPARPDELPLARAAQNGEIIREEEWIVTRADGVKVPILCTSAPIRDRQGNLIGGVVGWQDITERKRLDEERERSKVACARLAAIVENALDAIVSMDLDGKVTAWNHAAEELFGYTTAEIIGKPVSLLLPPECLSQAGVFLQRVREGRLADQYETVRLAKDGRRLDLLVTLSPLRDDSGRLVGASKIIQDITSRKRAEEALRRSQAGLAQAVRVARLGMFEHDHRTDLIEVSPELREIWGFAPQEPVTLPALLQRIWPEDRDQVAATIRQAHDPSGNGMYEMDHRIRLPGEAVRWITVRSQTFFDAERDQRRPVRTIGAVLDITERKELEAQLEGLVNERTAKLQEMVAELEHFSYTITHDLRAPLRIMRGLAGLLLQERGTLAPERRREYLQRIADSADRMDRLITDSLQYGLVVRGEFELEPVDADALLHGILESYPQFQEPQAHIRIGNPLPLVLGNKAGLTQCFSNLLGNAVKFVRPGQTPEVRVWSEEAGDARQASRRAHESSGSRGSASSPLSRWHIPESQTPLAISSERNPSARLVRIWFEDNGIGIEREYYDKIWVMFQRLDPGYAGTGIGLALVRKAVERMGGRVGVESEPGRGSRFWVELQLVEPPILQHAPEETAHDE